MIHKEALASKEMSPGMNIVLTTIGIVVNYVKIKFRIFFLLCKDMGAVALLLYCDAKGLSRGKCLQHVVELRHDINIFRRGNPTRNRDDSFLMKLLYLVDIYGVGYDR